MSIKENHSLVLAALNDDQIAKAKQANGIRKRITHALICGPYGQMFGTEKQCMKYYSVWVEIFPLLFSQGVRTDGYEIVDFKTTPDLVGKLLDAYAPKEQFSNEPDFENRKWNDMYEGFNSFANLKECGEAVVLDCETTGLDADTERVLQVGALQVDLDEMVRVQESGKEEYHCETFAVTLNPGMPIPRDATKVHGITDTDVADKPKFEDIAEELREWIGDRPIIGHNIQFDMKFLNAEFKRVDVQPLNRNKSFCTMWRYREWNDGVRKGSRLDDVARVFGLTGRKTKLHGAMEDTEITLQIALMFYMSDQGLDDCLPAREFGFQSDSQEYVDETEEDEGESWSSIVSAGVIVGFVALAVTCS